MAMTNFCYAQPTRGSSPDLVSGFPLSFVAVLCISSDSGGRKGERTSLSSPSLHWGHGV